MGRWTGYSSQRSSTWESAYSASGTSSAARRGSPKRSSAPPSSGPPPTRSERLPTVGLPARVRAELAGEQRQRLVAWAIFAVAALISILVLALAGRGQTLKGDEW